MSLSFFLLFFLEVAWVENCLSYAEGQGIERAMFFLFSASQLQLCSHFCLVLQQLDKLRCFPFYCPRPCAALTPMSTWQTASRMRHLAERGLQGCVSVLRNKFVYSFFLSDSLSHTSDRGRRICISQQVFALLSFC